MTSFVHPHAYSLHSHGEGAIRPDRLAKACRRLGMPAVAITDRDNLSGVPASTKELTKAGIQPITGASLGLRCRDGLRRLPLLVQNDAGWRNLMKLVSRAWLDAAPGEPPGVDFGVLESHAEGLIVLTGGWEGPVDQALAAGQPDRARAMLERLERAFPGRVMVELVRGHEGGPAVEAQLVELARELGLPPVAANPSWFLDAEEHEAHAVLLCIRDGSHLDNPNRRQVPAEAWLKPPATMRELFHDLPEACDNTLALARRCSWLFAKRKPMLPPYPGLGGRTEAEVMREHAALGLEERLDVKGMPEDERAPYRERLAYECSVIEKMGFPGYFLIVSDFIKWAKENDIPVGPGRGSGAGSVVAWTLKITDLDPLQFKLLFERFLNPDRVSMPDFDVDFCQERREEVIEYVRRRYGEERVAQIGTTQTLKARAAVKGAARVMQVPYPVSERIAQMIPNNPANPTTLAEAVEMEPLRSELAKRDPMIDRLVSLALKIEGLHHTTGMHAAGVVIADRPLDEIVPLMRDPKTGRAVTQFDMKGVEDAGLVKFDFLGLQTLDVIDGALKLIREAGGDIDFYRIDYRDPPAYAMLAEGDTVGVFQLESAGMRDASLRVRPSTIEDIVALVSLYRPGPMENIPVYAQRKHGEAEIDYPHPMVEETLADTFGIIVYQEQVMEMGKQLAGYSLGQADLLRRAMGKKIKEEMDAQREVFVKGCQAGMVAVTTEDGRTLRLNAGVRLRRRDGQGMATLAEALEQGLDVEL